MNEMISHWYLQVFTLYWQITVFPQLALSLCKESHLLIYFYLGIKAELQYTLHSPKNTLSICVKDLLSDPPMEFLFANLFKVYLQPFRYKKLKFCIFFSEGKKAYNVHTPRGAFATCTYELERLP